MDTIAPFKSRGEALRLYNYLNQRRIASTVINTPRRFGLGCGLSVVFPAAYRNEVESFIRRSGISGLVGFYAK